MGERRQARASDVSDDEKRALIQEIREAVIRDLAERTPDGIQEIHRIEAEVQGQIGILEKRIFDAESSRLASPQVGENPSKDAIVSFCDAIREDEAVYRKVMSAVRLYPNVVSRYLLAIVEAIRRG